MKLVLYIRHLSGQLMAAWRQRGSYPSVRERLKVLGLRITSIRSLRGLARKGTREIHVGGLARPVFVRAATSDYWVLEEIFEKRDYAIVENWRLPPDATVIDLGANIGLASRYFASILPQCRVTAVEPDPDNCRMIADNCRELLESGRLRIVQAFVAAQPGTATIDRTQDSWGFAKSLSGEGDRIECVTMEFLAGAGHIDLLKCDIEGTERELFATCHAWIGRVKHIIVETHVPYSLQLLYDDLRAAGWAFDVAREQVGEGSSLAMLVGRQGSP